MSYVSFEEVKQLATIEQVAEWLMLPLKQDRCQCPRNEGDKRELVLFPKTQTFRCFGCRKSGDSIELVSHVLEISQKEAALKIQSRFHGYTPAKKGLPESGLDYLEYDEHVAALGLSEEKAEELGIGFAPRGTMRGYVLFPMRDKTGKLRGYVGFRDGEIELPSDFLAK